MSTSPSMTTLEVGQAPTSREWYIQRVKTKLAMGRYQTEPAACFCGSASAQRVTETDRDGFAHPMWLCTACGLLYANPRLTAASAAAFYADDYPHLTGEPYRESLVHATDLEATLRTIHEALPENGTVSVNIPGLYAQDLHTLFTLGAPWQFTAETLAYVMECCGFEEVRADQHITSVWKKSTTVRDRADRPTGHVRDVANYLFRHGQRIVPVLRTSNKFPVEDRRAAIASATSRGLPEITDLIARHAGRAAVIIGGGPSVDGQLETIRALHAAGHLLLSIERMYPWCQHHGIIPDYVVAQDASDDVIEALTALAPGSTYLIASQCQPAVFDALRGEAVYFFHTVQRGIDQAELAGPTPVGVQVNSGGSVVLCSLSLAMLLGLAEIHLFGFDCHYTYRPYATGIAGVGTAGPVIQVRVEDRVFTTTPAYLAFAQQFFFLQEQGRRDGLLRSLTVYGDSLVTALSRDPLGPR